MELGNGRRTGQLLLLVALLFGLATMHTVGHPAPSSATAAPEQSPYPTTSHPTARYGSHEVDSSEDGSHQGAGRGPVSGPGAAVAGPLVEGALDPPHLPSTSVLPVQHGAKDAHGGDHGMDPSTVCLAVLAATGVVLAVTGDWWELPAATHPSVRGVGVRAVDTLRPAPPPPRTLLAQLSVLRT
ncbi:hypothetical protein [Streptomyces sp. NPDC059256]|uniref:hypothetical protein n=1 Tax=Streptomyces sp. NPDC059256 TaxID=3346794 RepID=UPI0036A2A93F